MPMEVFRELYKTEIRLLWHEVEQFRELCQREIAKQRALLKDHLVQCKKAIYGQSHKYGAPDLPSDISRELRKLEENMTFLETTDSYKDKCRQFIENGRVESVESASSLITSSSIVKQRKINKEVSTKIEEGALSTATVLGTGPADDEETQMSNEDKLNAELCRSLTHLASIDSETASYTGQETASDATTQSNETSSSKARKNWMTARKHLIDKMTLLEATVKRYRTELASATMKITAREMEMSQISNQLSELQNDVANKDRRIEDLEDRLMTSLADKSRSERNLELFMEELQNIELHTTIEVEEQTERINPPPKQPSSLKQRLLRKQLSSMSFFGASKDKVSKAHVGGNTPSNDSGEITPEDGSPELRRRLSQPPVLEDLNSNGTNNTITTRHMLSEFLGNGRANNKEDQTALKKQYGVDTSSRACIVM